MTYGPPPSPLGPPAQPPYGPPPGYGLPPAVPRPPASPEQRLAMLHWIAAGLGGLAFVWGFLDWYGGSGEGLPGFSYNAGAPVGLSIVAGLLAAALVVEKQRPTALPAACAVAAGLLALGALDAPGEADIEVGLILMLITSLGQAAVLGYAWLSATGRLRGAAGSPPPSTPPHSGPPPASAQPPGYPPPAGPPQGYSPPPSQWGPPQQ